MIPEFTSLEQVITWLNENVSPGIELTRNVSMGDFIDALGELDGKMFSDGIDAMGEDA